MNKKNYSPGYRKCIICGKGKEEKLSIFHFPTNENRQKLWLEAINNPQLYKLSSFELSELVICIKHFKENQFTSSLKRRLNKFAYPNKCLSPNKELSEPCTKKIKKEINDEKCSLNAPYNNPTEDNIEHQQNLFDTQLTLLNTDDDIPTFSNCRELQKSLTYAELNPNEITPKTKKIRLLRSTVSKLKKRLSCSFKEQNDDDDDGSNDVKTDDSILPDHSYHTLDTSVKSNASALTSPPPPLIPLTQTETKKKRVIKDTDNKSNELLMLACDKLSSEKNNICTCGDEFDAIGKNVAAKLRELSSSSPLQYIIAEKLISDVLFHGQLEALNRDSFVCVSAVKSVVNPDKLQITNNCIAYSIVKRNVNI